MPSTHSLSFKLHLSATDTSDETPLPLRNVQATLWKRASRARASIPSEPNRARGLPRLAREGRGQDQSGGHLEWSPASVGPDLPLITIEKHFLNFRRDRSGELVTHQTRDLDLGSKAASHIQ